MMALQPLAPGESSDHRLSGNDSSSPGHAESLAELLERIVNAIKAKFTNIGKELRQIDHTDGFASTAGLAPRWTIYSKRFDTLLHDVSRTVLDTCKIVDAFLDKISKSDLSVETSRNDIQREVTSVIEELTKLWSIDRDATTARIRSLSRTLLKFAVATEKSGTRRPDVVSGDQTRNTLSSLKTVEESLKTILHDNFKHAGENKQEVRRLMVDLEKAKEITEKQTALENNRKSLCQTQGSIVDFFEYVGQFWSQSYSQVVMLQIKLSVLSQPDLLASPFFGSLMDSTRETFKQLVNSLAEYSKPDEQT